MPSTKEKHERKKFFSRNTPPGFVFLPERIHKVYSLLPWQSGQAMTCSPLQDTPNACSARRRTWRAEFRNRQSTQKNLYKFMQNNY